MGSHESRGTADYRRRNDYLRVARGFTGWTGLAAGARDGSIRFYRAADAAEVQAEARLVRKLSQLPWLAIEKEQNEGTKPRTTSKYADVPSVLKGLIALNRGQYDEAVQLPEKVLRSQPEGGGPQFAYGSISLASQVHRLERWNSRSRARMRTLSSARAGRLSGPKTARSAEHFTTFLRRTGQAGGPVDAASSPP